MSKMREALLTIIFGSVFLLTSCVGYVNQPPVAALKANPTSGDAPLTVSFDGSDSYDPDGKIISYHWDFGDGKTGSGVTIIHTYGDDGTYTVILTVTDNEGATGQDTATIEVSNPPPRAAFTFSPPMPRPGETVTFDASGSVDAAALKVQAQSIVSYTWDFGDGATGTGMITTHIYDESGDYMVTLTVTDDDGATDTATKVVPVNIPPIAVLVASPTSGVAPLDVSFDISDSYDPDGEIVSFELDFGDGTTPVTGTDIPKLITHTYMGSGDFTATLTVTDDDGATAAASVMITVEPECTTVVHPGESIQAVIDGAPEGAIICLAEGEWQENITITKSLTLRGEGSTLSVIQGKEEFEPVLNVMQFNTLDVIMTLKRLKITKALGTASANGLTVQGYARVIVIDCIISENHYNGISLLNNAQLTVRNSTISRNGSYGIMLQFSTQARIENSSITGNGEEGISIWQSSQAIVTGSTISANRAGIYLDGNAQVTITNSILSGNHGEGIGLWDYTQATIENSSISNNGRHGIVLVNSSQAIIRKNEILRNTGYGIALVESPCFLTGLVFAGYVAGQANTIQGNAWGEVCPEDLSFLMTEEGGELDRR